MLPDALAEHWSSIRAKIGSSASPQVQDLKSRLSVPGLDKSYDRSTKANFSEEWGHYRLGDKTWGMELDYRVKTYFLDALRIPVKELDRKVLLDAGCGNGSQSVAYTEFGLEVIAIDLSTGLEHGHAYRSLHPGARAEQVHFVQGDLQAPPLERSSVDIVHSVGVLHHTPDTRVTFQLLCPHLADSGTFYVWVYKYEPVVTPIVNSIRSVTTRLPPAVFARLARMLAGTFARFCATLNRLGIRKYPELTRREAALALLDIFGAPHAHYHSFSEVEEWFKDEGFDEVWLCNETRRGFGVCGRRTAKEPHTELSNERPQDSTEAGSHHP